VRAASEYAYADLAWDGVAWLYLADRSLGVSGLRVFDATTGAEQTGAAIPTGLPPAWIVLPRDPQLTAVTPRPVASHLVLSSPFPNPGNPGCSLRVRGAAGARVPLAICDLRGRRLRTGWIVTGPDGEASFYFDGRDDRGRSIPSGSYAVVAGAGAVRVGRALQIVR
jgi:hypothetical protein